MHYYFTQKKTLRRLFNRDRAKQLVIDGLICTKQQQLIIKTLTICKNKEGLPYQVQPDDITRFFKDYQVTKSDVVFEEINGKKTGFGLVFFIDSETAQAAQENLNRKKDWKQICRDYGNNSF